MYKDISKLNDKELVKLINSRWDSSETLWETVEKVYNQNTLIYENKAEWINRIPKKKIKVQANRIFVNMEAVINSLIANPARINVIPGRKDSEESKDLAMSLERFYRKKYDDKNIKEILRKGLRNLYFGRLIVIKPFWNHKINDWDVKAIDPRKVRFGKYASKEIESEFAIEEIEDNICAVMARFPEKKDDIVKEYGMMSEEDLYIKNPEIKYKECWIGDNLICKYGNIILCNIKNPYFDWDGLLVTKEEKEDIDASYGDDKRSKLLEIKLDQDNRKAQKDSNEFVDGVSYEAYYYNYFDIPRKPYIFATAFNNENSPIGRTDMISMAAPLQESIDRRKQDIDENASLVNGTVKVDASVMDKDDAQSMRFEARGVIWGKGVVNGVVRETGEPLPNMVFEDMIDSRQEIDNIMAATSAFKGEREGQETKAGRLALIDQSYLRLNELVQVVDYVSAEMFAWFIQLAKVKYTEEHYAKWTGKNEATEIMGIMQDDIEDGIEIVVIPGKSLPLDSSFKFERAQQDVAQGIIAPTDYFEQAGYDNPKQLAKNAVMFKQNPASFVGIPPNEMPLPAQPGQLQPDQASQMMEAGLPPIMPQ